MNLLAAAAALKAGKGIIAENAGHLAGTVGAEVHEDDGIAILHAATLTGNGGDHEFISLAIRIRSLNGLLCIGGMVALAVNKSGISLFFTVPVVVTVHSIVTAADTGDGANTQLVQLGLQVSQESLTGMGVGITAVHDAVQINLGCAHMLGHFQHAEPVIGMAVNAAGTNQAHQVDGLAGINGSFHVLDQHGVLEHFAVLDGLGDQGELLVHDAASTHVGMANFRVAHLAIWQADSHARCVDGGHRVIFHQCIQMRLVGSNNGVAIGFVRGPAEAVHDAEHYRFLCH